MIKYSKKCHIKNLMHKGVIRIGTLHEYRNNEYNEGINDNTEGFKTVNLTRKTLDFSSKDNLTMNIKNNYLNGLFTGDGSLELIGNGPMFKTRIETPNCFIFCASSHRVNDVPRIFNYDAGVKIINPEKFIETITRALKFRFKARLEFFDKITYTSKDEEWNSKDFGKNPALFKDQSFSYQSEVRAIWTIPNPNLVEPLILQLPDLKKFIHPIKLDL